jgi:hypothetical protein|tara:strand:+ start:69 stop:839 length:771 start_codon:yes stop_codon:yes gene_type:complete
MVIETKLKGPLGEFIFQKFCIDHQIDFKRVNKFGRDFEIKTTKLHLIDVKTSERSKVWKNRKFPDHISYDVVFIDQENDSVVLYPDEKSPLYTNYWAYDLGSLDVLISEFEDFKKIKKLSTDSGEDPTIEFSTKISEIEKEYNLSLRFLFRVNTHDWRGGEGPDNIPGKPWRKFDATIYCNFKYDWDMDRVVPIDICVFYTKDMDSYPKKKPEQRVINKGINEIIDWESFRKDYTKNIFTNFEDLEQELSVLDQNK